VGVFELIEAIKHCEGQVVDRFPLRQYLGGTENSTVFLTDRDGGQKAAIKFVPIEGNEAIKQLSFWKRAAQLSHPHLLKIFESGRCQLGGRNQVYFVMEYAEENLGEILPQRALTAAEAREMLGPLLDCLGYVHGSGFVHGHVWPGNIMAVNNQLKLSSDSIRPAGEANPAGTKRGAYDAPETGTTTLSASTDIWSLGITLVEVLTQRKPEWETSAGEPVVPPSVAEPFREVARNCLHRDPNARWTVPQIKTRLSQPQPLPSPLAPVAPETTPRRGLTPVVLAVLVVLAIVGATALFRHRSTNPSPATSQLPPPKAEQMAETPAKPAAGQPDNHTAVAGTDTSQTDVVRQVPPKISSSAQRTIRGKIKLRVRVHVDPSGNVTRADVVSAGPSKYFARLVMEAARQWKFIPSPQSGERRWMLHFDLTRRGTTAHAQPAT
jgi:TonB family protein